MAVIGPKQMHTSVICQKAQINHAVLAVGKLQDEIYEQHINHII